MEPTSETELAMHAPLYETLREAAVVSNQTMEEEIVARLRVSLCWEGTGQQQHWRRGCVALSKWKRVRVNNQQK